MDCIGCWTSLLGAMVPIRKDHRPEGFAVFIHNAINLAKPEINQIARTKGKHLKADWEEDYPPKVASGV